MILVPPTIDPGEFDQRVGLRFDWEGFEAFLAARGESSSTRVTYLDGHLEIMSPSTIHEVIKKRIARLLEVWAEENDLELDGYGSWTVKNKRRRVAAEADECYLVGHRAVGKRPDLAIEVNWTSGGLDKLTVWDRLEVPEVWVWSNGALVAYRRRSGGATPRRSGAGCCRASTWSSWRAMRKFPISSSP